MITESTCCSRYLNVVNINMHIVNHKTGRSMECLHVPSLEFKARYAATEHSNISTFKLVCWGAGVLAVAR